MEGELKNEKLKPCPFCGGDAEIGDHRASVYVECTECGATSAEIMAHIDYCAKDIAIEKWNERINHE